MKKILIIFSFVILASTSGYSYTVYKSFYQDGNQVDMRVFDYTPRAYVFRIVLYALRTQDTYAPLCYAFAQGSYNGNIIFHKQAGSSEKNKPSYLNTVAYSYTSRLTLRVQCFFPAKGDRVVARVEW